MSVNRTSKTAYPKRFQVRRLFWTLAAAAFAVVLFLPVGKWGQCPASGDCVITERSILGLPTIGFLWVPVALAAGVVTWVLYTRRHR